MRFFVLVGVVVRVKLKSKYTGLTSFFDDFVDKSLGFIVDEMADISAPNSELFWQFVFDGCEKLGRKVLLTYERSNRSPDESGVWFKFESVGLSDLDNSKISSKISSEIS